MDYIKRVQLNNNLNYRIENMSEVTVEQLEEKVKEYKLRIFDMAEQSEALAKAFKDQQTQTQEFVTAIMQIVGMEITEQVMLADVVDAVSERIAKEEVIVEE